MPTMTRTQPPARSQRTRVVRLGIIAGLTVALVGSGALLMATTDTETTGSAIKPGGQPVRAGSAGKRGPVDTAQASRGDFEVSVTAMGKLEAKAQLELRNKVEGKATILEIVKEGSFVNAGDVLVKLNIDETRRQLEQELLALEAAKTELSSAESGHAIQIQENDAATRKAQLTLDLAELDFSQWLNGEVKIKRLANDMTIEESQTELDRARERVEKTRQLNRDGFLANDELQKDELAFRKAQTALEKARLERDVYENYQFPKDQRTKKSAVEEARAELERTVIKNQTQLMGKDTERSNKRSALTMREEQVRKLREQVEAAVIKAPSAGLVVYGTTVERRYWDNSGPFKVGSEVSANELLVALPDTSEMVAVVKVHESVAGRMSAGQRATVKIDALGGRSVPGAVETVGILAEHNWDESVREYSVRVLLDKDAIKGKDVRPSMRAEARIVLERVSDALHIPTQAFFAEGVARYVWIGEGSRWRRLPLKVGRRSESQVEVLSGLSAGQSVLLREPTAGERSDEGWRPDELAAAGLKLDESGAVVAIEPAEPVKAPSSDATAPAASEAPAAATTATEAAGVTP
ncbi:MAG: HlyD family efflux transporter periplasmic adaptor subunit [Phycisphaerales bacterium]|jgi:HlyD family secretion protein